MGIPSPGGGPEQLVLFLVLKDDEGHTEYTRPSEPSAASSVTRRMGDNDSSGSNIRDEHQLLSACQSAIRACLNPLFRVSRVVVRPNLPRNASNKMLRRLLRDELLTAVGPIVAKM